MTDKVDHEAAMRQAIIAARSNDWIANLARAYLDTAPRWVAVSERLPEFGVEVVICDQFGNVTTSWLCGDGRWNYASDGYCVTHWMPLPTPPEVKS